MNQINSAPPTNLRYFNTKFKIASSVFFAGFFCSCCEAVVASPSGFAGFSLGLSGFCSVVWDAMSTIEQTASVLWRSLFPQNPVQCIAVNL